MRARTWFAAATIALLFLAPLGRALGQEARPTGQTGVEFRSVSYGTGFDTKSLSEFAVPIGFAYPASPRLTLDAGTYFVSAQRTDATGGTTSLSGLTDVVVRGAYQLKPDVAVLTVAVNVPTGQSTINLNQALLANALASDLVPFPVASFGTGFSLTTGIALAKPAGLWAIGFAGSYRYTGSYQPLSDSGLTSSLKPGSEIRVRLGADRLVGQGRLSLGMTYSTFGDDEYGTSTRNPGARFIPQAAWTTPLGLNNSLAVYAWDLYRQVTDTNQASNHLNTVTLGAVLSLRAGARNVFRPQLEFRQSGGLTSGHVIGLSARYQMVAGERLTIVPAVRLDLGSVVAGASGTTASLTGFGASLMLRSSF